MKIRTIFLAMLIIAALVSTGSLTAFAAGGVNQIEEVISESSSSELMDSTANNIKDMAIGIRDSLDSQVKNNSDMVKSWAQSPLLQEAAKTARTYNDSSLMAKWESNNPDEHVSPQVSYYLADLVATTHFTEIVVTDNRGYTIAASGATDDFDVSSEEWFESAKASPIGKYIGAVCQNADSGVLEMNVVYSITDRLTGEFLGQVKAAFDYSAFIDSFITTNSLLVWEVKVVDQNGYILATSMIDKTKVHNPEMIQSTIPYFAGVEAGKKTGFTSETATDENGESVYYGYAISNAASRHIVVVSKKAYTVEAPISGFIGGLQTNINEKSADIQKYMWMVGGAVAILIVMAAFFVIRAKVSNPLNKLTDVSNKLSVGDIDGLELNVSGKDEIGRLGESFQGVLAAFNLLRDQAEQTEKQEIREPVLR